MESNTNNIPPAIADYGATNNKSPDFDTDRDEFTLDFILTQIGQFGRFQMFIFALICIPMMFHAIFSVTYVFTASPVIYR